MLLYVHEHEANDADDSKKRRSAELKHMASSGHLKQPGGLAILSMEAKWNSFGDEV